MWPAGLQLDHADLRDSDAAICKRRCASNKPYKSTITGFRDTNAKPVSTQSAFMNIRFDKKIFLPLCIHYSNRHQCKILADQFKYEQNC